MAELPAEVAAELKTLRAVKVCCVEFCKLFEALAACDPESTDEDDNYDAAMGAIWDKEQDICRRVMTLLPDEFPDGHVRRGAT